MTTTDTSSTTLDTILAADADERSASLPQFATVMRGYDRGQVEDYVQRLVDFVTDAEQRADRAEAAERAMAERLEGLTAAQAQEGQSETARSYDGLGERIQAMLALAAEEADDIRRTARQDAQHLVEQAERRCEELREQADRDLASIAARRDDVVAELKRVQDVLATLGIATVGAAPVDPYPSEPVLQQEQLPAAPAVAELPAAEPTVVFQQG